MDNLLHKLKAGELSSANKRRSMARRMSTVARRERRRTRSESVAMRAEDLLRHIQSEEEPPLPSATPTTRSRSGSRRLVATERMQRLASLAEDKDAEKDAEN